MLLNHMPLVIVVLFALAITAFAVENPECQKIRSKIKQIDSSKWFMDPTEEQQAQFKIQKAAAIARGQELGCNGIRQLSAVPAKKTCKKTGCSGVICSDKDVMSICIWKPEFECYKHSECGLDENGNCAWKHSAGFEKCKNSHQNVLLRLLKALAK